MWKQPGLPYGRLEPKHGSPHCYLPGSVLTAIWTQTQVLYLSCWTRHPPRSFSYEVLLLWVFCGPIRGLYCSVPIQGMVAVFVSLRGPWAQCNPLGPSRIILSIHESFLSTFFFFSKDWAGGRAPLFTLSLIQISERGDKSGIQTCW